MGDWSIFWLLGIPVILLILVGIETCFENRRKG